MLPLWKERLGLTAILGRFEGKVGREREGGERKILDLRSFGELLEGGGGC